MIGPEAYESDPLRPLRLARFAAELGFEADAETERLTAAAAPRVAEASGERIFAELRRLVLAPRAARGLALADRLGLVRAVLPELAALHDVEQSHYHHKDVYGHTRRGARARYRARGARPAGDLRELLDEPLADELTRGEALRLGALLHDIGKPATHDVRADGRVTFLGHDRLGEEMVRADLPPPADERAAEPLRRGPDSTPPRARIPRARASADRRAVYRYLTRTHPVEVEVTLLSCADRLATRGENAERAIDAHLELAQELMPAAVEWRRTGPPRLPIRGDELAREAGIEPGPELGRVMAELREAALRGRDRRAGGCDRARPATPPQSVS